MAAIVTTVVTKRAEDIEIVPTSPGKTGQNVTDAIMLQIEQALMKGEQIQSIALEIDDDEWRNVEREFHGRKVHKSVTAK